MDTEEYFALFTKRFDQANGVAMAARERGFDPESFVEIKAAPDLAARVEGIIGLDGLAEIIKGKGTEKSRHELAFDIVREICTNPKFEMEVQRRITLAVRIGLSILTEGILVAPTEGLQGVELHRNPDGTDYIAVLYAGPIRGAGGTDAALSVALADLARRIFNIGNYKATQTEVERWIEEMLIYDARKARLQYKPSEQDMRFILENCPVCVDGVPTEEMEVGIHRNMKRLDANGREQPLTNKIRGGVGLVICEGIAQKAKSVLKHTKNAGLDWSWLNTIIRIDKVAAQATSAQPKKEAVFLQELIAGRPVLAYPDYPGSFRLRYGRSRLTGIAAKGFSPASMYILEEFIATGTQIKVEKPGKGCIATPVDSIEGPFVKLDTGEALRVNTVDEAKSIEANVKKILSVGDILVTYGDFKKTNTPMPQTSYVEEYWIAQLAKKGIEWNARDVPSFAKAYELSMQHSVPMHPRWIYEYSDVSSVALLALARLILRANIARAGESIFDVKELTIPVTEQETRETLERLCVPHFDDGTSIKINGDDAQSLLCTLGFSKGGKLYHESHVIERYDASMEQLGMLNAVSPFKIMKRSTRIGARIGRPEKARERLMTPAPNLLFPIAEYGGKERNLYKAYVEDRRKLGAATTSIEIARYKCAKGLEYVVSPYCAAHKSRAVLERVCERCGRVTSKIVCPVCSGKTSGYSSMNINISGFVDSAMTNLGLQVLPKTLKGVKGLVSRDKVAEAIEKGILRSMNEISIFKDGTARFDATDTPMTHFYPKEIGTSIEKLHELGYDRDYLGNQLERDDQLVEMKHQDVVINRRGSGYLFRVARFMDDLLARFYKLEPFYRVKSPEDLTGHFVITLSPHTSCGVLGRIIGVTDATVGFAHPYTISARRRNCDGDEDTTMLLLDGLINFSRRYLPVTIGGTMDAPLILTLHVIPEEVDDEVHAMEVTDGYGVDFYDKTLIGTPTGDFAVELVGSRLGKKEVYNGLMFTHYASSTAVTAAPVKSVYTRLRSMQEKIDLQFKLMDKLYTIDRQDTARKLIISHFIPDLMGNLHSFSKQTFRCVACNAKYRRVPLRGKCTRCEGKIVLTISKGGIEKYLNIATELADRYSLEPYIRQRIMLLRDEIEKVFGGVGGGERPAGQFNLANYM